MASPKVEPGFHTVFVYGTLKKGFHNHNRLSSNGATPLGKACIPGLMFHLGGYPAVFSEMWLRGRVFGEVYQGNEKMMEDLDLLEGVSSGLYDRRRVTATRIAVNSATQEHTIGLPMGLWTYVQPHERVKQYTDHIPTGVWEGPNTKIVEWKGFTHEYTAQRPAQINNTEATTNVYGPYGAKMAPIHVNEINIGPGVEVV